MDQCETMAAPARDRYDEEAERLAHTLALLGMPPGVGREAGPRLRELARALRTAAREGARAAYESVAKRFDGEAAYWRTRGRRLELDFPAPAAHARAEVYRVEARWVRALPDEAPSESAKENGRG